MRENADAAPDVTFVTYAGLPDLDPDDRVAVDALRRRGLRAVAAVWDEPGVRWERAGTCVVRSTWDYHLRPDEFLIWAARVCALAPLWNSLQLIRWNIDKTYLRELFDRGAPVVPTIWIERGDGSFDVANAARKRGWSRGVVKPAVGLATFGVRSFAFPDDAKAAQAHAAALASHGRVLLQPHLDSVEDYGERALIFIDGKYSHAVRKTHFQALLPAGEAGEVPIEATRGEIEIAEAVAAMLPAPALYARIDLVRDGAGRSVLLEVELIEPSLFFALHPPAAERFADAVRQRL